MKKLVALFLITGLFISLNAFAQDNKAKPILDKVSAKIKTMKSLKANFSLTINDSKGNPKDTKKGSFKMKGDKYKIDMGEQEIICDAKSVWTYLKNNQEVQISAYNPKEQTISPAKLLSGSYDKEFNYSYSGEKTIAGKKVDVITLTSKKANQGFDKVLLYVDKSSMISGGSMVDKSGASYTYAISGITPNTTIADAEFSFDEKKHSGVEVIDLR